VKCFSTALNKTEIVREALKMEMDFKMVWPCYYSGEKWCGVCESCQRFRRAVEASGVSLEGGFQ
jgi:7-cyano-7-deazaguanine synthase